MRNDVGVLLIFFKKSTTLEVLKRILEAKPANLFLACDGWRNEEEKKEVQNCRNEVENAVKRISWDCKIYREYSDKNLGCDPREYSAITWAFKHVEKLIIIEDDCLCAHSFFPFMDEMLEMYKDDDRISMVSGTERFSVNPYCIDSYYFSQASCGWGWGSWQRIWNEVDKTVRSDYDFVNDASLMKSLDVNVRNICMKVYKDYANTSRRKRVWNLTEGAVMSWEFAMSVSMILNYRLCITPRVNLVKNIGAVKGATHSGNDVRIIPKRYRQFFENDYHEIEFPLQHPKYMLRDVRYEQMHDKRFAVNRLDILHDDIEKFFLMLRYSGVKEIGARIQRRLRRCNVNRSKQKDMESNID